MTSAGETAAAVFERINRRRTDLASASSRGSSPDAMLDPSPQPPQPVRVRVDEVLFKNPAAGYAGDRGSPGGGPSPPHPSGAEPTADRFPRSATMRLILKHPALALGLGVPAAGLLLKSPASRRLLGMAVRIGTGPELQQLIRFTSILLRLRQAEQRGSDRP
jgi:hypothetical protein